MQNKAEAHFKLAKEKFHQRDVEGAIQELDYAIQIEPENLEYILLRGDYLFRLDKHLSACEDFTRVIEHSDDIDNLEIAYAWRAHCYEYLDEVDKAIADVDWQIEHGFIHTSTYAWQASLKVKAGDIEGAINSLTQAHVSSPDAEDHLLKRAHAYYAAKRYSEALDDLNQILTFKDRLFHRYLAVVYFWRAKTYYRLGMFTEALADLNEAMRLSDNDTFKDISNCIEMLEKGDL